MTRLALFDLDDTLVDRAPAYRRWATNFAAATELSPADMDVLYEVDFREVDLSHQLRRVHGYFDVDEDFETFWSRFRDGYPRFVRAEAPTLQALRRLKDNGWSIGIVTNGAETNQNAKISLTGLDHYVDACAISEVEGVEKPDRRIFEAVAAKLGVTLADGGWMVGDSQELDVAGGRAAGLDTIWLEQGRQLDPAQATPTHSVTSVPEAVELMLTE
ncbi:putative hydrolase of the HAD superfamily [Stackebrandtia endophytica]|uniref:Putative hydrolase of the HAD superfamily n=1 Tax=Stackebrandtia endophytica TaxID=1496996 RepID=A0A543B0R3_9ACTN|nr:HAD family hydrolase [Stackebrandtia endophytica]TQL78423.1 putative hydrolase of the HAD superfamily [Stackebrandtia endophytica]